LDVSDFDSVYIDGEWRRARGSDPFPVINPFTEERVTNVRSASYEDVDDAVRSASAAMRSGPWSNASLEERCSVVERMKAGLSARLAELAEKSVMTLGHPISRARQVNNVASPIEIAIEGIKSLSLESRRSDKTGVALIARRPVGVVAAICPYNAPMRMEASKTVTALLAGCSVVLKPDPQTPYAARILAEVAAEAGLPPGVVNVVYGGGPTGDALVRHPLVSAVTFTGSAATGAAIGGACGPSFKRMVLELGGKSALIILDDADFDAALSAADVGNFRNAGQACIGLTRVLAPRYLYAEVVDALAQRAKAYVLGNPRDESTTMGPLVQKRQRERVLSLIEGARAEGARVVTGGKRPKDQPRGWFVEPTVLCDLNNSAKIAQEEVFGPVATIIPYDSEEQAVAIANDSRYGLHGAVFSKDAEHALRVARQIDAGTLGINCYGHTESSPFGGVKQSGIGREHGPESFDAFLEYITYTLEMGAGVLSYKRPAVR
jgi:aldehyde dehydrogenase (NAD+)